MDARLEEERGRSETRGGLRLDMSGWAPAVVSVAAAMIDVERESVGDGNN